MAAYPQVEWYEVDPSEITACDLAREVAEAQKHGESVKAAVIEVWDSPEERRPEAAELVLLVDRGVAGIAWGAPAVWVDANTIDEAIEQWWLGGAD